MLDRKAVALALIASFLLIVANRILVHKQAPKPRQVVAFSAVFLFISFLVEIAPKPAKYFAALFFLGTALELGPATLRNASQSLKKG